MSTCSTKIIGDLPPAAVVSYGYDKIRFPRPLYIGDTVTVTYEIVERDEKALKTFAKVTCTTDRGDTVAVGTHILKVVE
jgi:3-hydroxybutyryl-CoA dehydratase